jgi:hypothetical protein
LESLGTSAFFDSGVRTLAFAGGDPPDSSGWLLYPAFRGARALERIEAPQASLDEYIAAFTPDLERAGLAAQVTFAAIEDESASAGGGADEPGGGGDGDSATGGGDSDADGDSAAGGGDSTTGGGDSATDGAVDSGVGMGDADDPPSGAAQNDPVSSEREDASRNLGAGGDVTDTVVPGEAIPDAARESEDPESTPEADGSGDAGTRRDSVSRSPGSSPGSLPRKDGISEDTVSSDAHGASSPDTGEDAPFALPRPLVLFGLLSMAAALTFIALTTRDKDRDDRARRGNRA